MKKLLLGSLLLVGVMSVVSAKNYECNRYVNGKYEDWIKIRNANSKAEAESRAYRKYEELGKKVSYIRCKSSMF